VVKFLGSSSSSRFGSRPDFIALLLLRSSVFQRFWLSSVLLGVLCGE
jgi:hypothetical protein